MTPEERRKRMEERLAQMSPEEREQFQARMRERQAQGGGGREGSGAQGQPAQRGGNGQQPAAATAGSKITASNAATIDSLFGPLPTVETRQRVWLYINKQLKPVMLRLGISDGTWTEVLDANEVQQGTEVVTNVTTGLESQQPAQQRPGGNPTNNPLMGPQRGGRGR
jgi:hypothetical protein